MSVAELIAFPFRRARALRPNGSIQDWLATALNPDADHLLRAALDGRLPHVLTAPRLEQLTRGAVTFHRRGHLTDLLEVLGRARAVYRGVR